MRTKKNTKNAGKITIAEKVNNKQALKAFHEKMAKKLDPGALSNLEKFLLAAEMVLDTYKTFQYQTIRNLTMGFDLTADEARQFFDAFKKEFLNNGRIQLIENGCFDDETFLVV